MTWRANFCVACAEPIPANAPWKFCGACGARVPQTEAEYAEMWRHTYKRPHLSAVPLPPLWCHSCGAEYEPAPGTTRCPKCQKIPPFPPSPVERT